MWTVLFEDTKPPSDLPTEMPQQSQKNSFNGKIRQDLHTKVGIWNKVAEETELESSLSWRKNHS